MARDPIPTYFFALVVVRNGDTFALVQERKHGQRWYLPAGRAEPGESLVAAAERETLEEAGIRIRVTGLVRVEHTPLASGARVRAVFVAEPVGDPTLKSVADRHSLGARWVRTDELAGLDVRGSDVASYLEYVEGGGAIAPLGLLRPEHAPVGM